MVFYVLFWAFLMNSASAMAIVKCTQLKGLADKSDYTCKSIHKKFLGSC